MELSARAAKGGECHAPGAPRLGSAVAIVHASAGVAEFRGVVDVQKGEGYRYGCTVMAIYQL